jgi:hypothetical protein
MPTFEVHVAIINLVYRKSRRVRISRLVKQLRESSQFTNFPIVSVNFVEAVDGVRQSFEELRTRYGLERFSGWAIEDPDNEWPSSWRTEQTSGGIASGLSHLDVACIAKKEGWVGQNPGSEEKRSLVLVMEDDCVLTSSPEAAYSHFTNCIEELGTRDWDMLMLGAAGHRPDIAKSEPVSQNVEKAGFSYLTTMYWLSPAGVEKLYRMRPECMQQCLAFDELHNCLAGLTVEKRPNIFEKYPSACKDPLLLFSTTVSLVRQDPHDCVHDTAASNNNNRRKSSIASDCSENDQDVAPPGVSEVPSQQSSCSFELEAIEPFPVGDVVWFRRRPKKLTLEIVQEQFGRNTLGKKKNVKAPIPVHSPEVVPEVPRKPFGLMATLMARRRESLANTKDVFPSSFDAIVRSA